MEFFALTDAVAELDCRLEGSSGAERLDILVELAWQVRQRDSPRAQRLVDQAEAYLDNIDGNGDEIARITARLMLIRGELRWLFADLEMAQALGHSAVVAFQQLGDRLGLGDAHHLLANVVNELGDIPERDRLLLCAISDFEAYGDTVRRDAIQAKRLNYLAFVDAHVVDTQAAELFDPQGVVAPAVNASLASALGVSAGHMADFGLSAKQFLQSYRDATQTGQIRLAIVAACNGADSFASLGDMDSALEWDERGLEQARLTGWPGVMAFALMQTGHVLRLLGRHADANAVLNEALLEMNKLGSSRLYALTLQYLGDLSLDMGVPAAALEYFSLAAERATTNGERIFLLRCWNGQAAALGRLDRPQEALVKASAALSMAQEDGCMDGQIKALQVLAELYLQHDLLRADGLSGPRAALAYLQQALTVAAAIPGLSVPSELLDEVSIAYAACGDYRQAYEHAKAAALARDNKQLEDARNRAVAMQVRLETAHIRAEGERHREMAEVQAQRAAVLQDANSTLEILGQIGRDITASLNADDVFLALERHVSQLVAVTTLGVFLIDQDKAVLNGVFAVEDGLPSPLIQVDLHHPTSSVARCARDHQEIATDRDPQADRPNLIPGTRKTLSLLFGPLLVGERLLGVLTIQSVQQYAYGERERLIFRTLSAYGAIALDNANAYRQLEATLKTLRQAQAQLEEVTLTDPLTGMRNRRFLLQHIEGDTALTLRRYEHVNGDVGMGPHDTDMDLVFFMVDFDHFKSVNDTYGHAGGDMVLVQMRQRLQEVFRATDYLIRWGGEEFLLVARATNRAEAPLIAERIRLAVSSRPFELGEGVLLNKTCSIGFASFPFCPSKPLLLGWMQVVELADQALYLSKNGGATPGLGFPPDSNCKRKTWWSSA